MPGNKSQPQSSFLDTSGLSQKELAKRLGIKEQQLQRYEATEYAPASLRRVIEVTKALGLKVQSVFSRVEIDSRF